MVDLNSGELTTSMGMSLGGSLHPCNYFLTISFYYFLLIFLFFTHNIPPNKQRYYHSDLNFESEFSWGLQGYSWNTQPSLKPLVFNPPYPEVSYNFSEPPINAYEEAGFLQPKSNIGWLYHSILVCFEMFFDLFPFPSHSEYCPRHNQKK